MAVLPYFAIALPLGFGRLSADEAKSMGVRLLALLMVCWSICFLVVAALPIAFPVMESASFFSTSAFEVNEGVDFINLYIPSNPFRSLTDAVIPGVVVFGISLGIALIRVPEKEKLLGILNCLADALTRITGFVVKLTPIGVFALSANAAGTMTIEELSRLQVYLVVYTTGAMMLALWFLPMLVSCMTSFRYIDIFRVARDPMITGFTTGNLLVVLAMLAENCKSLFQKYNDEERVHAESIVDVSLPIAFTFPNVGVVLILLFVPFAAWFTGNPMSLVEFPGFLFLGFFSFFGSVEIGLPFLLKNLSIPTDMFQLHIVTLVYIGRVATFVAVMHMAVLAILTAIPKQHEKPSFRRFMYFGLTSIVLLTLTVTVTRAVLYQTVDRSYTKNNVIAGMQTVLQPLRAEVYTEPYAQDPLPLKEGQNLLDSVDERGHLRVGYDPDGLPFSFFNAKNELVGFDVELIQAFANDMGYDLHFYPYKKQELKDVITSGRYDLVIGGLMTTPARMRDFLFSPEYLELHLAIIVKESQMDRLATVDRLKQISSLTLGVLERPYFVSQVQQKLPNAKIVLLSSPRDFFIGGQSYDAMLMSAEAGSAWTLMHPEYSVIVPPKLLSKIPVAFPVGRNDERFAKVLGGWIDLKRRDASIDKLYQHWILGKTANGNQKRWSVLDNVIFTNKEN